MFILGNILIGLGRVLFYFFQFYMIVLLGRAIVSWVSADPRNAIVRFLAWNMPYHTEHHAFPSVPFHALPSLHGDLRSDLNVVAAGYVAINREIFQRLQ